MQTQKKTNVKARKRGSTERSNNNGTWNTTSIIFGCVISIVILVNLVLLLRFETVHRDAYDSLSISSSLMEKQQMLLQPTNGGKSVARLAQMLIESGDLDLSLDTIWEHHSGLYGNKPRLIGLEESCKARTDDQPLAIAGLMETHPNQLYDFLASNCFNPNDEETSDSIKWAPDWGRHAPIPQDREKLDQIPVVVVRDPYTWLQALCTHQVKGLKLHDFKHCPHLKKNFVELQNKTYDSLLHLWNSYYDMYLQTSHPRIIVRYEDVQLFPKEVVKSLCACVGGTTKPDFDYHAHNEALKDVFAEHLQSMQQRRWKLTAHDFDIARDTLSKDSLRSLGYVHVPGGYEASSAYEPVLTPEEIATMGAGKERLVELLNGANIRITKRLLDALPTWQRVVDLYGPEPVLHHLEESCSKHDPNDFVFAISGMFNSGTNALYAIVERNCPAIAASKIKNRRIRWQVPWGKHEMPYLKRTTSVVAKKEEVDIERILPIVTVRDPYFWMQSMCRHSYEARWSKTGSHCPNLVATSETEVAAVKSWKKLQKKKYKTKRFEKEAPPSDDRAVLPIRLQRFKRTKMSYFDSLIDYWMEWHNEYRDWNETRILIRVEDLVYHPEEVVGKLCECAGGGVEDPFEYQAAENSKADPVLHGYSNLLIRYAQMEARSHNMTPEDLAFARERLETDDLMEYFGYRYHPSK